MNRGERDTRFTGWASQQWEKLMAVKGGWIDVGNDGLDDDTQYKTLLAQGAYDLVKYVTEFLEGWEENRAFDHSYNWEWLFEQIPDKTE